MQFSGSRFTALAFALTCSLLAGCASFEFTKPAPPLGQPAVLKTSGEELSGWTDLPLGVYRIPDSHVIVSGHQKGQAASLLFGLVGVAVVHAANAGAGAEAVSSAEKHLKVKLNDPVDAAIRQALAGGAHASTFTLEDKPGAPKLLVTPALVLSFVNDDAVRPYVVLKATLVAADGKPGWTTRYIASTGEARTLMGANGWLLDDAAAFRRSIDANVNVAVRTMVADISKPYARDESRMVVVQGHLPYVKQRLQTVGFQLTEDDRYLAYIPKIGDVLVFAGVNIVDKSAVTVRAATKEDPPLKAVD